MSITISDVLQQRLNRIDDTANEALMNQINARQRFASGLDDGSFDHIRNQFAGWVDSSQRRTLPVPDKPEASSLATVEYHEADLTDARVGLALEVEDVLGYTPLRAAVNAPSRLRRCLQSLDIPVFEAASVDGYKAKMAAHFETLNVNNSGSGYSALRVEWRRANLSSYTKPVPEHVLRKCVQIKKEVPEAVFQVDELVQERQTLDPFMVVSLNNESLYFEVWDEPEFEKAL